MRGSTCQTRGFTVLVFGVWWQAGPGGLCRMWGEQQSTGYKERQAGKWSAMAWAPPSSPSWMEPAESPPRRCGQGKAGTQDQLTPSSALVSRGFSVWFPVPGMFLSPPWIPWPSTPSSQSHEENVLCVPMNPATPVPRAEKSQTFTTAIPSSGGAGPSPEQHLCQEQS